MKVFKETIKGFEIKFKTKPGVFSPSGLDSGTRLLIDNLKVTDASLIADLGSGTGVLGIILAKLNPKGHIHLLDDHLRSVRLAEENVLLNNLINVEVYLSDLFSAVEKRSYNQIYANPPAQLGNEFLKELVEKSYQHLKPQGELVLVVVKNLKEVMRRLLEETFKNSTIITTGREHIVIKARR